MRMGASLGHTVQSCSVWQLELFLNEFERDGLVIDLQLFFVLCGLVNHSQQNSDSMLCQHSIPLPSRDKDASSCGVPSQVPPSGEWRAWDSGKARPLGQGVLAGNIRTLPRPDMCRKSVIRNKQLSLHRAYNLICKPGWKTADWHTNQPAYIEFRRGHSHSHDHDHHHHHHHHHHHCKYIHHHPSNSFPHTLLSQKIVTGFRDALYKICWPNGDFTGTKNKWLCVSNQSKGHFVCPWQVFFSGYTIFTGGSCIILTWYTIFLMFVLKTLTTNLLSRASIFWWMASLLHNFIRCLNCDCGSPVACWTLGALPRSKELFAQHWMCFASLSLVYQCIDRDFLAEFVRIMTSDEALLSKCLRRNNRHGRRWSWQMILHVLVAFRRHLCRAFLKPDMLSEIRHGMLELLAGWPASDCTKRFRLGQDGGLRWGTSCVQKLCIPGSARGELERRKLQSWGAALEERGRRL